MKERISYFDLLRGVAIIGVVAIHSISIGYKFDDSSIGFIGTVVWKQLINFAVPLFLSISGYFLADKIVDNRNDYLSFLKKQLIRIILPYIFWSILYLGIESIQGANLQSIIIKFISFQSTGPFYFISLIIQYYLLLPVLQKLASLKGLIISLLISVFCCMLITYIKYYTFIKLPFALYASAFPTWILFFTLGLYLKNNKFQISKSILKILVILGLGLSIIETYVLYDKIHNIGESATTIKVSSFIFCFFIIIYMFSGIEKRIKNYRMIIYIGEISFGIYLSHMFFMSLTSGVIHKFMPFIYSYALIGQFTLISLTVINCIIMNVLAKKLNAKYAIRYLGL